MEQAQPSEQTKLYNIIFPVWLLIFFPPVILVSLVGNWIIDSIVLTACYFLLKPNQEWSWLKFYKKNIVKVWFFGFLADFIGAALLYACVLLQDVLGISDEIINGITYDPYSNFLAFTLILVAIFISGLLILLFNYNYTFRRSIKDVLARWKAAALIAVVTLPWTFLLPAKLFY